MPTIKELIPPDVYADFKRWLNSGEDEKLDANKDKQEVA